MLKKVLSIICVLAVAGSVYAAHVTGYNRKPNTLLGTVSATTDSNGVLVLSAPAGTAIKNAQATINGFSADLTGIASNTATFYVHTGSVGGTTVVTNPTYTATTAIITNVVGNTTNIYTVVTGITRSVVSTSVSTTTKSAAVASNVTGSVLFWY